MPVNHQFSLAVNVPVELKAETHAATQPDPVPATPTLSSVLADMGSLPREALFLGMALDGLPVLLNLHDPVPGPILIVGDARSGKTSLLKMVASAVQQTHRSLDVQFSVITSRPGEWKSLPMSDHHAGIFSVEDKSAQDCILSLASWAHGNKSHQSVLLMIDDMEAITKLDVDVLQNLRWLLLRGASRRVWVMAVLDTSRYGEVISWIPMFRTRLFGRITSGSVRQALGSDPASALDRFEAGTQFSLRENGAWLQFWVPSDS